VNKSAVILMSALALVTTIIATGMAIDEDNAWLAASMAFLTGVNLTQLAALIVQDLEGQ
jgi:hypothetical protein